MSTIRDEALVEEQRQREHAQRQAAIGRRVDAIQAGRLGPVVKRWINADIVPIADNLRRIANLYLLGDMEGVALALGTPTSALSQKERPLRPLMEWCLRGSSPGRAETTTHAEDLALAFMGALVPRLAASKEGGITLSAGLSSASEALKDTVQGQFIVGVQGAKAMQKVRSRHPEYWQQKKSLQRIAMQMQAQVKPQMLREERGEVELETVGHRKILHITDYRGDIRRLELLRAPDAVDWEVMSLCWQDPQDGATHPHRSVWLAFAAMMLSLAQQSGGWFDVADKFKLSKGRKRKTKMLLLSERAHEAVRRDVERWVGNGFLAEPMLVPPVDGDWLTVKHRKVTGQRPPKGLSTDARGSFAWEAGALALASSPWRVNPFAVEGSNPQDSYEALKVAAHRRLGAERDFYLPVNMDFRGRVYYRTPWVTPQSDDLGKSLLCFPPKNLPAFLVADTPDPGAAKAIERHLLDIKPRTEAAHRALIEAGRWDDIPLQLDGTCNGLQHLSALTRDEVGAAAVNLTQGGEAPSDIYGRVAKIVEDHPVWRTGQGWCLRVSEAGLVIDRTLCKGPVMVLPYGGTIEAIRLNVKATVLGQLGVGEGEAVADSPWHRYEEDGYGAFRTRALADHPLFNLDIMQLATLIHSCIAPAIPKAMAAMDTLQAIGSFVGERGLAWRTGPEDKPLWVVQAKSKSARKQVTMKGYHLPDVIRRLTLVAQTNEVDPRAHRTGIVANFIHSLDAEHLSRTIAYFKEAGGSCVGSIHDCLMCRPSEAALMHEALRQSFRTMYSDEQHPLSRPVKLIGVDGEETIDYASWHKLAEAAGSAFPEFGEWMPSQVLSSEWFFS